MVRPSQPRVFGKCLRRSSRRADITEEPREDYGVDQCAVRALTREWQTCVRRIAKEHSVSKMKR